MSEAGPSSRSIQNIETSKGVASSSHFAPAFRPLPEYVVTTARFVERSPVISTILKSVGRPGVVLDKHRLIVGTTEEFQEWMLRDGQDLLGLRIGEAMGCVHAGKEPAGCGTTPWCCTCGAAIATHMAQVRSEPVGRECALHLDTGGDRHGSLYSAWCAPIIGDGPELYFLSIRRRPEKTLAVDRDDRLWSRLQDLSRTISDFAIRGMAGPGTDDNVQLLKTAEALEGEVYAQLAVMRGPETIQNDPNTFRVQDLFLDLRREVLSSGAFPNACLDFRCADSDLEVRSLRRIVHVVLGHMLSNAVEASEAGETVVVEALASDRFVEFTVSNTEEILPHFALRVFEKHFTTKESPHRGLGTWTVKLLGEEVLGGEVWFTSTTGEGTRFHLRLPASENP